MFPGNVPKLSLWMFPECSHEKFYERSIQILSERSYRRFRERSLWIFSEYCFGAFKKPGHFLSSRNVPMEPSEHSTGTFIERSGKVLCYGGYYSIYWKEIYVILNITYYSSLVNIYNFFRFSIKITDIPVIIKR